MSEHIARIKPKKSTVSGEIPLSSDLEVAELAINTADGKIFTKHTDNSIKEISGSGGAGGGGTIADLGDTEVSGLSLNDVLIYSSGDVSVDSWDIVFNWDTGIDSQTTTSQWGVTTTNEGLSISTTASKFGPGSLELPVDQTGGLALANSPKWALGESDFTIELWWRPETVSATAQDQYVPLLVRRSTDGDPFEYDCFQLTIGGPQTNTTADQNAIKFTAGDGAQTTANRLVFRSSAISWVLGEWYHIAVTRTGDTLRMFLNGQIIETGSLAGMSIGSSPDSISAQTSIGNFNQPQAQWPTPYGGYIDQLAIDFTDSRYQGSFSPSSSPISRTDAWRNAQLGAAAYTNSYNDLDDLPTQGNIAPPEVTGTQPSLEKVFNQSLVDIPLPSTANEGDLAAIMLEASGTGSENIVVPTGWTEVSENSYGEGAACDYMMYARVYTKTLDATDIATGLVTFTGPGTNGTTDWAYWVYTLDQAQYVSTEFTESTTCGSTLPDTGYDYSGPSVGTGALSVFWLVNNYAYNDGHGWEITPEITTNGFFVFPTPQPPGDDDVATRSYAYHVVSGTTPHNITVLNNSGNPGDLTNGFRIIRVNFVTTVSSSQQLGSLSDVDTGSVAPENGDALVYRDGTDKWVPGMVGRPAQIAALAPSEREDGSSLQTGDSWLNTTDGVLYIRDDAGVWTAVSSSSGSDSLGLDDLTDVVYNSGSLEIDGLDEIVFEGPDVPSGITQKIYSNSVYGFALRAGDVSGTNNTNTNLYIHHTNGVSVGLPSGGNKLFNIFDWTTPIGIGAQGVGIRFSTGNPVTSTPTGSNITFRIDPTTSGDTDYVLPLADGTPGQVLSTDGTGILRWVDQSAGGGGGGGNGGGGGYGSFLSQAVTASNGTANFDQLGHSGVFQSISSDQDAWVVIYASNAQRVADAGRTFVEDPAQGSGVLAEFYLQAGVKVFATPGSPYFNADLPYTDTLYAAVRTQQGGNVDAEVTINTFGQQTITKITGGTY